MKYIKLFQESVDFKTRSLQLLEDIFQDAIDDNNMIEFNNAPSDYFSRITQTYYNIYTTYGEDGKRSKSFDVYTICQPQDVIDKVCLSMDKFRERIEKVGDYSISYVSERRNNICYVYSVEVLLSKE